MKPIRFYYVSLFGSPTLVCCAQAFRHEVIHLETRSNATGKGDESLNMLLILKTTESILDCIINFVNGTPDVPNISKVIDQEAPKGLQ